MTAHIKALDKAKIGLMSSDDAVFFTHVCFSMRHEFDESIPTACTNGTYIKYNPQFFMNLSRDEQIFLLLHETLHVALSHIVRRGDRDRRLWNVAGDYVINLMLVKRGFKMPEGGLLDHQYDGWTTVEIYDHLHQKPPEEQEPLPWDDVQEPGDGDGSGGPGDSQPTPAQIEETQQKIDDILIQAALQAEMSGKGIGDLPGELAFYIQGLRTPKLPWHRLLRQFMTKAIKRGYTWKKPNRRFFPRHYLPSRNSDALCDIAAAMDLSASVTDEELKQYASEAYNILVQQKPTSLTLIQFDTSIRKESVIHTPKDLANTQFHGRGGTRIGPVIDWAARNKPTVLLIFTDGHFALNSPNPKVPVVWVINNNPNFQAPYGKVIHYDVD